MNIIEIETFFALLLAAFTRSLAATSLGSASPSGASTMFFKLMELRSASERSLPPIAVSCCFPLRWESRCTSDLISTLHTCRTRSQMQAGVFTETTVQDNNISRDVFTSHFLATVYGLITGTPWSLVHFCKLSSQAFCWICSKYSACLSGINSIFD